MAAREPWSWDLPEPPAIASPSLAPGHDREPWSWKLPDPGAATHITARRGKGSSHRFVRQAQESWEGYPWWFAVPSAALGVVVVGWSYTLSRSGTAAELYYAAFWAGLLLALVPVAAVLLRPSASPTRRLAALLVFGSLTAVPKYLRNPGGPLYHDEYAHWREAVDVLASGRLMPPNTLIPIVQFFPGTSAITVTVERLTGLSLWHSGQLVVAVVHVLSLVAVFILGQVHLGSARAGAVAALVYAVNPSAIYFDTQYAYESVAMGLFLSVLAFASLAGRTHERRLRVGYTAVALLCAAGCVVTHHLTTVFLILALLIVAAGCRLRRPRRREVQPSTRTTATTSGFRHEPLVWSVVLLGTLALAGLWLGLVARPTVSYLSPYFGGSLDQLATLAKSSTPDAGRQVLASSVQPLWERGITAAAPVLIGLVCLVGLRRYWRDRSGWSRVTLSLMAFGMIYFPSVPFILAPSGAEGARRSWGFTYVGLALVVAFVLVNRVTAEQTARGLSRRAQLGALALVVLVLVGNVGGGLNDPYRFPGPFRWGTDTNSASDEARTVARQLEAQHGRVRVVTDSYTALQLAAYGGLDVAAPSQGFPAWDLSQTPTDPSPELAGMLFSSHYDFLVVDERMAQQPAFNGANYGRGDPLLGQVTPQAYLDRLDHVPWASRVMATEHLRVYQLDLMAIGQKLEHDR